MRTWLNVVRQCAEQTQHTVGVTSRNDAAQEGNVQPIDLGDMLSTYKPLCFDSCYSEIRDNLQADTACMYGRSAIFESL